MNKNKFTSWGVRFGSMTFVAGIIAFLGFTNGGASTQNSTTTASSNPYNQSQDQNSDSSQGQWGSGQPLQEPLIQGGNGDDSSSYGKIGSSSGEVGTENHSQFQTLSGQEQYDTRTGGTSF
jgi:hypothetical protein